MPLGPDDHALVREAYRNFSDRPLEPGSPFYEPIYQEDLGLEDPVETLATLIDFEETESIRLFSGFRGSGKTTELQRLRRRLEDQGGYFVLYADALEYLNPAEPIEIGELLIAIGGAFGEALQKRLETNIVKESFFQRAWRLLSSDVQLKEVALKSGGDLAGLDLKFELKSPTSFRVALQQAQARKLQDLKLQADAFFEEGVKAIRQEHGADIKIVFIFDQLEQLRGSLQSAQTVIQSVRRVFETFLDLLRLPYMHVVYSVPPWLKFILPNTVDITLLSTVHLWENDPVRTPCEPARAALRSLIRRRISEDGLRRLFGAEAEALSNRLIDASGGHFRDLMRMCRDVLLRAMRQPGRAMLPVGQDVVDEAISAARRDFMPIPLDELVWLRQVGSLRKCGLQSRDDAAVDRLSLSLDTHYVLYFRNGDDWYDIHPLIRDEVEQLAASLSGNGKIVDG